MLRVREGVVLPSVDPCGACRLDENDCASEGGVEGAEDGAEESSKARPRGRGFSIGPSSTSCGVGWLMVCLSGLLLRVRLRAEHALKQWKDSLKFLVKALRH